MKEMYQKYRKLFSKKNKLFIFILFIVLIGLVSGSLYITILNNSDKTIILNKIGSYYNNYKNITMDNKLILFKNSFLSNFIYYLVIWLLGISIIGVPIVLIMIFFKSFIFGFSISSIYAKYKLNSLLKIILYLFPCNLLSMVYSIFLSFFSVFLSINLLRDAFSKKTFNFGSFMGKYMFLLLIGILLSVFIAIFDAFIIPLFY